MDILVDTQAFIWFCDGDERLPNKIRDIMNGKENNLKVSIASLWEMTIKMSIKKLTLSWSIAEVMNLSFKNRGSGKRNVHSESIIWQRSKNVAYSGEVRLLWS